MSGASAPGGFVIGAPASGQGKTVTATALMRALGAAGKRVGPLKIGPDFIDPAFHAAAAGRAGRNFDAWAMRPATRAVQLAAAGADSDIVVAEGVMGLFDGADAGGGSTADAAAGLGWPVVLVIDVSGQGASAAALIEGFARHRADVEIAGVIANRVASPRHGAIIERAVAAAGVPCLGLVPRNEALALPSRHLGLVQAGETAEIERWLDAAAKLVGGACDLAALAALAALARPAALGDVDGTAPLPPLGGHIAIARDDAFSFLYEHILDGWRRAGCDLSFFSPLADQAPDAGAEAIYLPGGYPELHARHLAANPSFLGGLREAAERGTCIYGECGGFMVLGEALVDAGGTRHALAGLLPVATSFAERKLHLGYRRLTLAADGPLGAAGAGFRGHEFHYSTLRATGSAEPLFDAADSAGEQLPAAGCRVGSVAGSYIHLIDSA